MSFRVPREFMPTLFFEVHGRAIDPNFDVSLEVPRDHQVIRQTYFVYFLLDCSCIVRNTAIHIDNTKSA